MFPDTAVVDTRESSKKTIRRRRECVSCKWRFSTQERIIPSRIVVEKRSGERVAFSQEKIIAGIELAAIKRPLNKETIVKIAEKIEQELVYQGKSPVRSWQIGVKVMKELRKIDKVAYLRFASVYRRFRSLKSFEKELDNLNKSNNREG